MSAVVSSRPSFFRRVLASLARAEHRLAHDPLVEKDGKALVLALVVRGLVYFGIGGGVSALVLDALHSLGV